MEEYSIEDPTQLLEAASDFAHLPGARNEASVKQLLHRFPFPVFLSALQTRANVPGLQDALVACLELVFETKYGASLIPQYMSFLQMGLKAESQKVRYLACKTVSSLFRNTDDGPVSPSQLLIAYDLYPMLLDCLVNGDEPVSNASLDAIEKFAASPDGLTTIFPPESNEATDLRNLSAHCSSLGRVRVLALIVKLFSVSHSVASVIFSSNLLGLLEAEANNTNDTLVTLSVLELLYELAEAENAAEFLSKTTVIQILGSITSNTSVEPVLRSRALMISGRMLSKENSFMFIEESCVKNIISTVEARIHSSESENADEVESALVALGQIGSSRKGASLLLSCSPDAARRVIEAAFDRQRRGQQQLAAIHALGNIVGENRSETNKILDVHAEESLRRLIYETAADSTKLTPSGLLLSVLRQETEVRLAGYKLISNLVARPWCLLEICAKQEIINTVTDSSTESVKIGMEARYNCCEAIHKNLVASNRARSDSPLAATAAKLQDAVKRGPYLAQRHSESQPTVMTEQRF